MTKTIILEDKISTKDDKQFNTKLDQDKNKKIQKPDGTIQSELGEDIFTTRANRQNDFNKGIARKGGKSPVFYTEVEFYAKDVNDKSDNPGELLHVDHNELVLPGALFLAEKLTNVDAPIQPKTINSDLGIAISESLGGIHGKKREHVICLFGVGIGGSGTNFNTVLPVNYNEREIKNFIPIRRVETGHDLSSVEKEKYFMKKVDNGFYEYYLKKFEIDPTIKVEYDEPGNPAVPGEFDKQPSSRVINLYMQFNIKISKYDVREYFKTKGGGIKQARINTLGLFVGYPEGSHESTEYKGVQLFSKLNFNNEPLDNETKELNIIYKIYIA